MRWQVLDKTKVREIGEIVQILLRNRGIRSRKEQDDFFDPPFPDFDLNLLGFDTLIREKLKNKEKIIVYGDYDADGVCGTAILWEWLSELGANVLPYLPLRDREGYGLSIEGIKNIDAGLIITVDNGISAEEAIKFANMQGIDVLVIDHHQKPQKLPPAREIIWSDQLCAASLAYFAVKSSQLSSGKLKGLSSWLELAAIATITDLLPLIGINRSIVKHGLKFLNKTERVGLKALFEIAELRNREITPYEVGYIIGPRINASGRIDNALVALRLLCTRRWEKAVEYARILDRLNAERQLITRKLTDHAVANQTIKINRGWQEQIVVLEDEEYHQGIIGLVASKLVEHFYLPVIVIAKGERISKASARSIAGFNIIEAIRSCEHLLIGAGGHPMAAGFTILTEKIAEFKQHIYDYAGKHITPETLEEILKVDCELDLQYVNNRLLTCLNSFSPYGLGNPEPIFVTTGTVQFLRAVGTEGKHLKLLIDGFDAVFFNGGNFLSQLKLGQKIKIAYSLTENSFDGKRKLQLKIRDIIC